MNCKTRGEKIDEALESVKRFMINTLLIIWACITVFLGIALIANWMEIEELNNKLETMSIQKERVEEKSYIIMDGHRYEVVDMHW